VRGNVKVRGGVSIVLGICAILVVTVHACGVRFVSAQSGTGWSNMLYESFSGPAGQTVDPKYWKYDTGSGKNFGNGEVETMTDSPKNVSLDGAGNLDITALGRGGSWTSGRIQTTNLYGAPAGGEMKVVASIKQPSPADGLGYWPAFWLLGPGTWPEDGEIDVLEDVNALSLVSGALHCGNLVSLNPDRTAGPCHEHRGLSSGTRSCAGCQIGYHTYSVIVDRRDKADEQISWYLDGRKFYEISERQVGTQVWTEAVDHGFSIIFDLAIGGSYPNGRCGCTTPTSLTTSGGMMSVRYLAVYDR
jgi:beta-glucanase (GH16 family)